MKEFCLAAAFALTVSGFALSSSARAQETAGDTRDEEARLLFQAGESALTNGRYDDALQNFERSHELSGRPELLFNIGVAHDRLRHDEQALAHYRRFLEESPDAPNRADAESRIAALERALAEREAAAAAAEVDIDPRSVAERSPALEANPVETPEEAEGGIASKWWFWAIVGVVVVGAAVAVGVTVANSDSGQGFGEVAPVYDLLRASE